jgi:hypothetical protein
MEWTILVSIDLHGRVEIPVREQWIRQRYQLAPPESLRIRRN